MTQALMNAVRPDDAPPSGLRGDLREDQSHTAQFYETDSALCDAVAEAGELDVIRWAMALRSAAAEVASSRRRQGASGVRRTVAVLELVPEVIEMGWNRSRTP